MPNDESTPEMFENRNGWSCVRTVSSQPASVRSSQAWTASGPRSRAQPDVAVHRVAREQLQVAPRQPFEESRDLLRGQVGGPVRR